ncbi:3',5'-cyclic-nucleotide phosphodiesterase [Erysiphe neolycopersici]|uniref:3',5'-cyclic-nucleotide phosphodiesterase n=1 Tax=Erysiphe neolycopersici TaxID=212602 RepID=A0A420HZI4_9PEZI|nr:3',5'-cyclic-nucleotide phosphodiesterase [Erysiphe neolycopersici]
MVVHTYVGTGGGPFENNTTAFLVRSVAKRWSKGSLLAVDAGVHLAAISKILEKTGGFHKDENIKDEIEAGKTCGQPGPVICSGPFEGLELQYRSLKANAGYIAGALVDTYLITHPHLDHISGLVVNSSGLTGIQPKRIAGLSSSICALKTHIFNNIIWPNLTNENNGAGLISFIRLVESRSSVGNIDSKKFVEVCDGLEVSAWGVSHGRCLDVNDHATKSSSPTELLYQVSSMASHSTGEIIQRNISAHERTGVIESSAFFIRDKASGTQILIFGDVEPDSVSLCPRNKFVWEAAAPRIVTGELTGIFIECSYDDTRAVDVLFGHLAPRYLIEEIKVLAAEVDLFRNKSEEKLKHECNFHSSPENAPSDTTGCHDLNCNDMAILTEKEEDNLHYQNSKTSKTFPSINWSDKDCLPLKGLKIIIIHTKENLDDSPNIANLINQQLLEHEKQAQLGCEFIISRLGQSLHF